MTADGITLQYARMKTKDGTQYLNKKQRYGGEEGLNHRPEGMLSHPHD